jgi:hypothetical protein
MQFFPKFSLRVAAAKAGMSLKTASKYLKLDKIPSELERFRAYRTRQDPFIHHAQEIEDLFQSAPELQAKTLLAYLIENYPGHYHWGQLRSLQRRLQQWRVEGGPDKEVIFRQVIKPGQQSQSDWTHMKHLGVKIAGEDFDHLLFHFILSYSTWESVMVCHSESFETLTQGYEKAVWQLGGILPEHRTDNLSAATQKLGSSRQFTEKWQEFLDFYHVQPSRNNPGQSHENGSIEKSHHLLKTALDQHLLLRGSRSFISLEDYEKFLENIINKRNQGKGAYLLEELSLLKPLPEKKYNAPVILPVRVTTSSLIQILGVAYSVPSRLIGHTLKAYVYGKEIELYYGQKRVEILPRIDKGALVNYRHIIDSLVRKPNAFAHYQYRDCLFPQVGFRQAYDGLIQTYPEKGHKHYLKLLQLAKMHGEQEVLIALQLLEENQQIPLPESVKALLDVPAQRHVMVQVIQPCLADYDSLHSFQKQEAC